MLSVLGPLLSAMLASTVPAALQQEENGAGPSHERPPEDEIVYFLLPDRFDNGDPDNDRGGLSGGRLDHGFDPADPDFYHGGDLAGLLSRLDYLEALGATAIWLGPVYGNKPVQGPPGRESAGYHGYWITDFTGVDPHLGTMEEMKALADAVHDRGMKLYLDIVVNHTADVIAYEECDEPGEPETCVYRGLAPYPYTTRGGPSGRRINRGFSGEDESSAENFAALRDSRWAYTPYVPENDRDVKRPAWLNDPIHYHNRGDTDFTGESSFYGDFFGLDDLFTESPVVTEGMIDIYGDWIETLRLDGFRVDTARHVRPAFWQAFLPAVTARAEAAGVRDFFVFGEVAVPDAGILAAHTRNHGFPAVLDFALQLALVDVIAKGAPTQVLRDVFDQDVLYAGGEAAARRLPTFVGNHDDGRFATYLAKARPDASEADHLKRTALAHAFIMTARGVPVIYAGSEQGFVGDGGFGGAREDMFQSRTASYVDNDNLGSDATPAASNFDTGHPLFTLIAELAAIRKAEPALRRGRQVTRLSEADGGLFAFSRIDDEAGTEIVMVVNAGEEERQAFVPVEPGSARFTALSGDCPDGAAAQGSLLVTVPPASFVLCKAMPASRR